MNINGVTNCLADVGDGDVVAVHLLGVAMAEWIGGWTVRPAAWRHPAKPSRPCDGAGIDSTPAHHHFHGSGDISPLLGVDPEAANQQKTLREATSASGISTKTATNVDAGIESYLGLTLDNFRSSVLFRRGCIAIDMVLKLQSLTGI